MSVAAVGRCSVTLIDLPPTLADFDPDGNWDPVSATRNVS